MLVAVGKFQSASRQPGYGRRQDITRRGELAEQVSGATTVLVLSSSEREPFIVAKVLSVRCRRFQSLGMTNMEGSFLILAVISAISLPVERHLAARAKSGNAESSTCLVLLDFHKKRGASDAPTSRPSNRDQRIEIP